jgi:hypothetical protein
MVITDITHPRCTVNDGPSANGFLPAYAELKIKIIELYSFRTKLFFGRKVFPLRLSKLQFSKRIATNIVKVGEAGFLWDE